MYQNFELYNPCLKIRIHFDIEKIHFTIKIQKLGICPRYFESITTKKNGFQVRMWWESNLCVDKNVKMYWSERDLNPGLPRDRRV